MKILYTLMAIILFISCSDNLSHSKAKRLIEDCLEKDPKVETVKLQYGKISFRKKDKDLLDRYKILEADGYLTLDSIGVEKSYYGNKSLFNIVLTDKSTDFIIEQAQSRFSESIYNAKIKVFEYEVDEIKEIQEIPSFNSAEARVNYKRTNITPFVILRDQNETDFKIVRESFGKTSEGWKFCED